MIVGHVSYRGASYLGSVRPLTDQVFPLLQASGKPYTGDECVALIEEYGCAGLGQALLGEPFSLSAAVLMAPIPRPQRNLFCVGKNYHEHAREFNRSGYDSTVSRNDEMPDYPIVFTKATTCVIGPEQIIELHSTVTAEIDYEAELAIVIGKAGRGIAREDALSHVFGYTIVNDVTARDLQKRHKQWFLGKSLDSFCPMGPWIVTAESLPSSDLDLKCWVNGELRQQANTRDLIFDIPSLIACLSAGMTLLPGDIIATGTPAGVGVGFTPPKFLRSGDRVRIEIEGIGSLANTVA